jgi:hypothetical protein
VEKETGDGVKADSSRATVEMSTECGSRKPLDAGPEAEGSAGLPRERHPSSLTAHVAGFDTRCRPAQLRRVWTSRTVLCLVGVVLAPGDGTAFCDQRWQV